jgi:hypothetical protein
MQLCLRPLQKTFAHFAVRKIVNRKVRKGGYAKADYTKYLRSD